MPFIESLDNSDYVNSINGARTRVCEYGYQHVFFYIEWPRIQREFPAAPFEEGPFGEPGSHELAQRDYGYLSRDGCDGQGFGSVPEELVQKGQQDAGERPQHPHSEGEDRKRRVVCGWYRKCHLRDWRIFFFFFFVVYMVDLIRFGARYCMNVIIINVFIFRDCADGD